MIVPAVDVGGLIELVWIAPLAAVAVTATFSACVLGATRSSDSRRAGEPRKGALWFVLAVVAGLAAAAMVAAGILVIVAG